MQPLRKWARNCIPLSKETLIMDKLTTARLYFLFALMLLGITWKITNTATHQLIQLQAQQAAQIDRALGAAE